jgi:hypothetical protein
VAKSHQDKTVLEAAQPHQTIQLGQSEGGFTLSLPVQAGNGHESQRIVVGHLSRDQIDGLLAQLTASLPQNRSPVVGELKASLADPRRRM